MAKARKRKKKQVQKQKPIKTVATKQTFLVKEKPVKRAGPKRQDKAQEILQEKPHIYRIYSRIVLSLLFLITIVFFLDKQQQDHQKSKLVELQTAVLVQANGAGEHEALGRYYEQKQDFANAQREYQIAQQFGGRFATTDLQRLAMKKQAPTIVRQTLDTWQRFVDQHPNYKDGWLQIAAFWWELGNQQQARQAVEKAVALDQTDSHARAFLGVIQKHPQ